ncbi:MAG: IS1595 family transposase [Chitinophagales bacterium]
MKNFNNLIEVITHFSDKKVAKEYLFSLRWKDGIVCPYCNGKNAKRLNSKVHDCKCYDCRKPFSVTKGTIFENSPIPLQKWYAAIYLITAHKKGISSHQLARDLSLTQKSAWFVLQRVRFALQTGSFEPKSGAILQVDETYVGGKEKNKHQSAFARKEKLEKIESGEAKWPTGRSLDGKTPVVGMLETGGKVTAKVVKDTTKHSLLPFIHENAKKDSIIVTDEHRPYWHVKQTYAHHVVNHKQGEYVSNGFHTNGIENFWSLFKRGIIGIYHQISDKHLDKYVDEFEFRYNSRKMSDSERFENMLTLIQKRLTYSKLISPNGNA